MTDLTNTPIFNRHVLAVQIDTYSEPWQARIHCDRCSAPAEYQVHIDAGWDGNWQQACERHLGWAVAETRRLQTIFPLGKD
jgi:hypothetical protein